MPRSIALRYGLFLGLAEIIYGVLFRLAGVDYASPLTWVFYLMLPAAIWMGQRAAGRITGSLSYGRGLSIATGISALGAALYSAQVWLYNRFLDDSLLRAVRADQIESLRQSGVEATLLAARTSQIERLTQAAPFALAICIQLIVFGVASALLVSFWTRRAR